MTYRGTVKGGVVVLDGSVKLPDGAAVRVDVLAGDGQDDAPSLFDRLESVVGKAKGLPVDAAKSIDRDLYGPKRP